MDRIRVVIATHKNYIMPDDAMYLPLFVGAQGRQTITAERVSGSPVEYERDDSGDNISDRNSGYSELTGMYWAVKNLDSDYIGLSHYRRYFKGRHRANGSDVRDRLGMALTFNEAAAILKTADIILPSKRRYYIESLYSHYDHTHNRRHLDMAAEIIEQKYPGVYSRYIDTVYRRTWGYMYNMFIMSAEDLREYSDFLFPVLFELEDQLCKRGMLDGLSPFEARLFGRVSEILLNVWIEKKRAEGIRIAEVPTFYTEKENMLLKGTAFLKAKFLGKKYKKSF